jgi:hypothetical protein
MEGVVCDIRYVGMLAGRRTGSSTCIVRVADGEQYMWTTGLLDAVKY